MQDSTLAEHRIGCILWKVTRILLLLYFAYIYFSFHRELLYYFNSFRILLFYRELSLYRIFSGFAYLMGICFIQIFVKTYDFCRLTGLLAKFS